MHCQVILEMLSPYLDGVLDPAEHAEVQKHLASCPACNAEFAELKACINLLQELPDVAPPADFRAGLMEKIDRLPAALPVTKPQKNWYEKMNGITRKAWYRTAAVAAVMAMTIGITSLWQEEGRQFVPTEPKSKEIASVEQPTGKQQETEVPNPSQQAKDPSPMVNGEKSGPVNQGAKVTPTQPEKRATSSTAPNPGRKFVSESYQPQASEGMVARSVILTLDVQDQDAALETLGALIQGSSGSIVAPYTESDGYGKVGIKVPSQNFRSVESHIKELGKVITDMPTEKDLSEQHKQAVAVLEQLKSEQLNLEQKLEGTGDEADQKQLATMNDAVSQQTKIIKQIEQQCNYTYITITIQ